MDLAKPFIGRDAVRRELDSGLFRVLVGLRLEGRMAARPAAGVLVGGQRVGEVTSGLFAPSLNIAVAMARVDQTAGELGQRLEVEARGKLLSATVVPLPSYQQGTARRK